MPQGIRERKKKCNADAAAAAGAASRGRKNTHLQVLLDGGLESLGVGTDDLADLFAVLEEQEGGHGADAEFLGDVWDLVDVDLVEAGVGVGVGEPVGWGCLVSTREWHGWCLKGASCDSLFFLVHCGARMEGLEECVWSGGDRMSMGGMDTYFTT